MARVTVEDCLENVENRFDLVIKASKRAHMLELGEADPQVPVDNDKPTVIALREIAENKDITKTRKSALEEEDAAEETEISVGFGTASELASEMSSEPSHSSSEEE